MNRKQIIAITVLGIVALLLGCKPDATGIGEVAGDPTVKPKPVRELTAEEKKLAGTYERKSLAIYRYVYLENGKKQEEDRKWSIVDNELRIQHNVQGEHLYFRMDPDNSITQIAYSTVDKRTDLIKERQHTYEKIK